MKHLLVLLISLITISSNSYSQKRKQQLPEPVDPQLFSGMEYRSVGPSRGGRSTAIAGIADEPYTFFMGGSGSGVWKTTDAGTSWNNIGDGSIEAGSIGAITVAPSDKNIVYVGTGSACMRGNVSIGIGMYKSQDGGDTWEHVGLENAGQIGKVEVHPTKPEIVFVAALGNAFGPNPERGLYRTKNGGQTWEKVLHVSDSTGAIDVVINPANPNHMYAAMWRAERKPHTLIDGGQEGGIWKSIDGGDSWKKMEGGLPTGVVGRIGLSISPSNPDRVWALIQTKIEKDGGLYRSDNGGKLWTLVNGHHKLRQRGWYYTHITADPKDENTIYASNTGFYKSIDGGKTFEQRIRTPHGDNHGVWINPNNTDIMINCNDGGANVSLNGGKSWSTQRNQPTSEFYRITVDNQYPYRLYAGQQDNSTISVPSKSGRTLTPFKNWMAVGGGESGDVAVDPNNPNIIYSGTYSGEITRLDLSNSYKKETTAYPHYTEGTEQRDLKYRWQWNFPVAINPHNSNEVFHTSNYVHKSTNGGEKWEIISPDLTRNLDKYHGIPGGPVQHDGTGVEIYSTIFSFEISPHNDGEYWTGSDDGLIHISRDFGKNWNNVTPIGVPEEGTVNKIELSSHQPGKAFAVIYNYRNQDPLPYIYQTNDYGDSWAKISENNGIPRDHFVRTISEDPKKEGLLFAGTEFGIYVSFNEGKSWQSLQLKLPKVPVSDMEIAGNDLVISTQGRAFWILEDLAPLRSLKSNSEVANRLFEISDAVITNLWGEGAKFQFYLTDELDSLEVITATVVDQSNTTVRTFTSNGKEKNKLKIKKGFNTFYWDLTHEGPEIVDDFVSMVMSKNEDGPTVMPGTYNLLLSSSKGWELTEPFEVKLDPRWDHISIQDLQDQVDLGLQIRDEITESHQMIKSLRSIRTQSQAITKHAKEAGIESELEDKTNDLDTKLTELEDMIIQNKIETSQDAINYPRKYSNHIGRVYSVLRYTAGKPTAGVLERHADVQAELNQIKTMMAQVLSKDVEEYNQLLKSLDLGKVLIKEATKVQF